MYLNFINPLLELQPLPELLISNSCSPFRVFINVFILNNPFREIIFYVQGHECHLLEYGNLPGTTFLKKNDSSSHRYFQLPRVPHQGGNLRNSQPQSWVFNWLPFERITTATHFRCSAVMSSP